MKLHTRKSFKRMIALLLAIIIFSSIPITVSAEQNIPNMGDTENGSENTISLGEGGYSYTPPGEGAFLIENTDGALSITNDNAVLQFDNRTVTIPAFDYYKIVDKNGKLRFYQADVAKNPIQAVNFVYIAIYAEDSAYTIHIHYKNIIENKLYNMVIPLTQAQFLYFDQRSTELCMGADEVSQRLKASARVYMQGVYEDDSGAGDASINAIVPADPDLGGGGGGNTIDFDEYTNSDGIIRSYVDNYFGEYFLEDGWTITDDPIVEIIPKELFFTLGTHIHVGKQYGFFVRTTEDTLDLDDYAVDVMVFDITHFEPAFAVNSPGGARVTPLFQYRYRATDESSLDIDPSLSRVVIPHLHYDTAEYFLKGTKFKFTLENPTALNPGDYGYDPYEDNGAFIIQTRANINGVAEEAKKDESLLQDTVEYVFGFHPIAGPALATYAYVTGLYEGFVEGAYFYHRDSEEANNESLIFTDFTNNTDQIDNYDHLIKSVIVNFEEKPDRNYLVHVNGGYAEGLYVIARKSGSQYDLRRVITSITVNIVEDNTYIDFWGNKHGETVDHGNTTGTYEIGEYKRLYDISPNGNPYVIVPDATGRYIVKVTVPVSGSYRIYTTSSSGDPNFYIMNAAQGTYVGSVTDDINGASNRNATLTANLVANEVYYLIAYRYGTPYEYTLRIEQSS